jgi:AMMECR1 domain-containing protein
MSGLILVAAMMAPVPKDTDKEALEIGKAILAVDKLLEYQLPDSPTEADKSKLEKLRKAAVEAGHSQRMYRWVTSRIQLEMETEESFIRDTKPDKKLEKQMRERIEFLGHVLHEIHAPR